jgi:c-di-GMP-binding flagellar brake protein YcgR
MSERRSLLRFDIQAPAKIVFEREKGKRETVSLVTKDISSSGAFVVTQEPLSTGMSVKLELLLSLGALQRMVGEEGKAKVQVRGKVIRIDDSGMAIQFDSRYKFLGGAAANFA